MTMFNISTKITGTAYGTVEADSEEAAKDMFDSGQVEMKLEEWDICTDGSRGGYLDISKCDET